jgi:hypothetical protein
VRFPGGFVVNPGGLQGHQMKVAFSVAKDLSSTANDGFVEIWNLNEGHRNAVGRELKDVELEVGYMPPEGGSNVGLIAVAQIRDVVHRIEKPDIITRIEFGEGDKAFRRATISKTWPANTRVETILEDIAAELEAQGIRRGEWVLPEGLQDEIRARPVSVHGDARREIDILGRSHRFYFNVQNGVHEIIPADGFIDGTVVLESGSGLIDVPSITDNGCTFSCMMLPDLRPGRKVQINSKTLQMNAAGSQYRVSQATYTGDNKSGDFRIDGTGEAIQSDGKVDEGEV